MVRIERAGTPKKKFAFLAIYAQKVLIFLQFFPISYTFLTLFFLPILPKPYKLTCQPPFLPPKTNITPEKTCQKSQFFQKSG